MINRKVFSEKFENNSFLISKIFLHSLDPIEYKDLTDGSDKEKELPFIGKKPFKDMIDLNASKSLVVIEQMLQCNDFIF
jgi:hypothetical protein